MVGGGVVAIMGDALPQVWGVQAVPPENNNSIRVGSKRQATNKKSGVRTNNQITSLKE